MSKSNREIYHQLSNSFPSDVQKDLGQVLAKFLTLTSERPPLGEALHHILVRGRGKLLRPSLLLLTSRLQNSMSPSDSFDEEAIVNAAVSVELLHIATLIHDDVIDKATMRRGNPTVNALWGNDVAILLADFSYAQSLKFALKTNSIPILSIFTQTAINIVKSEILSRGSSLLDSSIDFTNLVKDYYEMIDWRTAGLFGACSEIGSILARGTTEHQEQLRCFGLYIGRAFQIVDDILDFVGSEALMGKPIGNDLRNGVLTLPTIFALKKVNRDNILWQLVRKRDIDASLALEGIQIVKDTGSIQQAYTEAQKWIREARHALHRFPGNGYRTALDELAEYMVQRLS